MSRSVKFVEDIFPFRTSLQNSDLQESDMNSFGSQNIMFPDEEQLPQVPGDAQISSLPSAQGDNLHSPLQIRLSEIHAESKGNQFLRENSEEDNSAASSSRQLDISCRPREKRITKPPIWLQDYVTLSPEDLQSSSKSAYPLQDYITYHALIKSLSFFSHSIRRCERANHIQQHLEDS